MKIHDFDEFQGVTTELVHRYLNHKGWCSMPDPDLRLLKPSYVTVSLKNGLAEVIEKIALIEGRSAQGLLREINPRMRKGMPSQAARDTHAGLWVGHMGGEFPSAMIGYWYDDGRFTAGMLIWDACKVAEAAAAKYPCAFWPCDENGNKVRWPTDANGVML